MEVKLIIYGAVTLFIVAFVARAYSWKRKAERLEAKVKGLEGVKKVDKKITRRKKEMKKAKEEIDNAKKSDINKQFDS